MSVFEPALREMNRTGSAFYGPEPFQQYLNSNGFSKKNTWQMVSVDSISRLDKLLEKHHTMVFRLGRRASLAETHFGLARVSTDWADYFLIDEDLVSRCAPQSFLPNVPVRDLFPFQLMPKLTETSLVNLAIGSGLLHHALGIEWSGRTVVPATGQSTFDFRFRPRPGLAEPWDHLGGQVEIDAVFVAPRAGRETLFVVEAKSGPPNGTLAKHKLVYAMAALRGRVPRYIDIVPIYLKTWAEGGHRHFMVVECAQKTPEDLVVSELLPQTTRHMVLPGFAE